MELAKVFTGIAMPLILGAYMITVLRPHKKRTWSGVASVGAIMQLIGGILYRDLAIIALETVFLFLNIYAFGTTYAWFNLKVEQAKAGFKAFREWLSYGN